MPRNLTIIVCGMISAELRQGGATWAVLQYLLGLRRLGHEVYFIEWLQPKAVRPVGARIEQSENAVRFFEVMRQFGFQNKAAVLSAVSEETAGLGHDELCSIARRADVLLNISGMMTDKALLEPVGRRVFLDLDPAFNQLWHAACGIDMHFDAHTHFVTVGQALGKPSCRISTCDREWIPTVPPVVLEEWPVARTISHDALTTIANFRGYGSIEHAGIHYGQKVHSLRKFFQLPSLTKEKFELAMAVHPEEKGDLAALISGGWHLLDPAEEAGTPDDYRKFIQGSKAEFGIAKSGYVNSRCGWFSDRSVCYLASGRPVIAQETGFSDYLPVGEGLFSFEQSEDVLAAVEALNRDYERHSRAAREIAESRFDSDMVLPSLLERILATS